MPQNSQFNNEELIAKLQELPEDAEIPEELLDNISQDQLLNAYVEQLIQDKGVEGTDDLREKLYYDVNSKIDEAILASLPDYMVEKLKGDINDDEVSRMIEESGINLEEITEKAMVDFREAYLNEGKEV